MSAFGIHLDSQQQKLIWRGHDNDSLELKEFLGERKLDVHEFKSLTEQIAQHGGPGSRQLFEIGRRLYALFDGPERWLAEAQRQAGEVRLVIDTTSPLRNLPWELLADERGYLSTSQRERIVPIRWRAAPASETPLRNAPLRLLFMACSPLNLDPVLHYEHEEAAILTECRRRGIELIVEESGSRAGLREQLDFHGAGYFDAVHITGHAGLGDDGPWFAMEDEMGRLDQADASAVIETLADRSPRLAFLSGCSTARAAAEGAIESMVEALLGTVAPVMLGWSLPVGDLSATALAAYIYRELATGATVVDAVSAGRRALFLDKSPYWHLLRLYISGPPPGPYVTPSNTKGRERVRIADAPDVFLDAKHGSGGTVCPRERFVGRRRPLQRFLKILKTLRGADGYHAAALIYGLGGQGKSSLAARICERMGHYERIVVAGETDESRFIATILNVLSLDTTVTEILEDRKLPLRSRMQPLLGGQLANRPLLFVFDDFERNLELSPAGGHVCQPEALKVLAATMAAIHATSSDSRALITSWHDFAVPSDLPRIYSESLEPLRDADLEKKLRDLTALSSQEISPQTRGRAIALAGGNPRLLEYFDCILRDPKIDADDLLEVVKEAPEEERLHRFIERLLGILDRQDKNLSRLAAQLAIYRLPVDRTGVLAITDVPAADTYLDRAVALGIVEGSLDPHTMEPVFFTPLLVAELLCGTLTDEEDRAAADRFVQQRYGTFNSGTVLREAELLELFRLADVAAQNQAAVDFAATLAETYLNANRYQPALDVCRQALGLGESLDLLVAAGRAESQAGVVDRAERNFRGALDLVGSAGSKTPPKYQKRASVNFHFAKFLTTLGEHDQALTYLYESRSLYMSLSADHNVAVVNGKIADILQARGELDEALRIRRDEVLPVFERLGDVRSRAVTQVNLALCLLQRNQAEDAEPIRELLSVALADFDRLKLPDEAQAVRDILSKLMPPRD